ncbi:gamma-glutamylcyclotransferase family protein [Reyranella sp.]|uniref:gamma-glutamylcyclotransferase family protein n=1 Tax=Reyranella sp. TaxID=1929291 RepID=UPI0011FBF12C|nr:gamma-glutamylcyclotransferase family protein [Reyranella sp.]TAJ82928.1 MAG: gamma-glutamylcyclotransferase [Reyranella sp.]
MSGVAGANVWLFSYGTLQQDEVQLATFGRRLEGRADALPGYATSLLEIKDADVIATSGKTHHLLALPTGNPADEIAGVVFKITPEELAAADTYEVSDYKRVAVRLKSGLEAFVYVAA